MVSVCSPAARRARRRAVGDGPTPTGCSTSSAHETRSRRTHLPRQLPHPPAAALLPGRRPRPAAGRRPTGSSRRPPPGGGWRESEPVHALRHAERAGDPDLIADAGPPRRASPCSSAGTSGRSGARWQPWAPTPAQRTPGSRSPRRSPTWTRGRCPAAAAELENARRAWPESPGAEPGRPPRSAPSCSPSTRASPPGRLPHAPHDDGTPPARAGGTAARQPRGRRVRQPPRCRRPTSPGRSWSRPSTWRAPTTSATWRCSASTILATLAAHPG